VICVCVCVCVGVGVCICVYVFVCVKFCSKLFKNFTETFHLPNRTYVSTSMGQTQCYQRLVETISVGEHPRPGRHSTTTNADNVERFLALIRGNRPLTVRGSCWRNGHQHRILPIKFLLKRKTSDVSLHCKIRAAFVDRRSEMNRADISQELLASANGKENSLNIIITHEARVNGCDVETKIQQSPWKGQGPPREKRKQTKNESVKDQVDVGCVSLIGKTFNIMNLYHVFRAVNKSCVRKFWNVAVHRKRHELWENRARMLHHDGEPVNVSFLICSYLAKYQTSVVPHPTDSPDLAPAHILLFPKIKPTFKGCRFQTIEEIQKNAIREPRHHRKCVAGSNPTMGESTISRKLLKMDILTFETC